MNRLVSLLGICVFMAIAYALAGKNRWINYRVIVWGLCVQAVFAFFIFRLKTGTLIFSYINSFVLQLISFAAEGSKFLFGPLALPPGTEGSIGFVLAFQALPAVIFFSSLLAFLYYIGIMSYIIQFFSYIFTKLMNISGAESLCASSNIFVGIESALTVRPYLEKMTQSELCVILTAGMGTIASTVLAIYVSFLQNEFPNIAGHLVSASLLSAPASVIMAKLIMPETDKPVTLGINVKPHIERSGNWIEAIIRGANDGVKLCVGIGALLIAFLGLLALVNWLVSGGTGGFLTLQKFFGMVSYPLTWLMGIPADDVGQLAPLLGERIILTEVVSYNHLAELIKQGIVTNPRSIVIMTYALCGFAHIASLAIFVGGISAIVPSRAKDLARISGKALIAATLACLMTGAIAGIFCGSSPTVLFQ
ncbi:MAG: nucleoside transporter C-terminal domain-containing protein [bacterium]